MSFADSHLGVLREKVGSMPIAAPGVQVAVTDPECERVLLQRRVDTGEWEIPGGACEPQWSFAENASRELEEETGIPVDALDLTPFTTVSGAAKHTLRYPNGDVVIAFAVCFHATLQVDALASRTGRGDGEAEPPTWFEIADLPAPMHAPTLVALRRLLGHLRTGGFVAE